jgi:hypothetical protein
VSQAQAAVKDLQKNEEAQKWAEQVRGNVGALRGFGEYYRRPVQQLFTDKVRSKAASYAQ